MELYVHTAGHELKLQDFAADITADDLAEAIGLQGAAIWPQDADAPLKGKSKIGETLSHRDHVSATTCKKVQVTVRYGGPPYKEEDFPPAATFQAVFAWATGNKGYDLTPEQKAKHALGFLDTGIAVDRNDHLAGYIDTETCTLTLDLAPKERFAG